MTDVLGDVDRCLSSIHHTCWSIDAAVPSNCWMIAAAVVAASSHPAFRPRCPRL